MRRARRAEAGHQCRCGGCSERLGAGSNPGFGQQADKAGCLVAPHSYFDARDHPPTSPVALKLWVGLFLCPACILLRGSGIWRSLDTPLRAEPLPYARRYSTIPAHGSTNNNPAPAEPLHYYFNSMSAYLVIFLTRLFDRKMFSTKGCFTGPSPSIPRAPGCTEESAKSKPVSLGGGWKSAVVGGW